MKKVLKETLVGFLILLCIVLSLLIIFAATFGFLFIVFNFIDILFGVFCVVVVIGISYYLGFCYFSK